MEEVVEDDYRALKMRLVKLLAPLVFTFSRVWILYLISLLGLDLFAFVYCS